MSVEAQAGPVQSCAGGQSLPVNGWNADMPVYPSDPAKMVMLLPSEFSSWYEGTQWVFTSAQGLQSSGGTLSCKGLTTGETVPVPALGTPGPTGSCQPKLSSKYSGTFRLNSWPCLRSHLPEVTFT